MKVSFKLGCNFCGKLVLKKFDEFGLKFSVCELGFKLWNLNSI